MANAGWYDDPAGSGRLRYFDGENWTEHLNDKVDDNSQNREIYSIFDLEEENINNETQRKGTISDFKKTATDENFSELKKLDKVKNEKNKKLIVKKKNKISKKIYIFVGVTLVMFFVSINVVKFKNNSVAVVDKKGSGKSINEERKNTKEPGNLNSSTEKNEESIDVSKNSQNVSQSEEELYQELDKAIKKYISRYKKTGITLMRSQNGREMILNISKNNNVRIEYKGKIGYGDSKYLYIPKSLALLVDNDKNMQNIFKTTNSDFIKIKRNEGQVGTVLFSDDYYDGSNLSHYYPYILKNKVSIAVRFEGSSKIYSIETRDGNDWVDFEVQNGELIGYIIDKDSSVYETSFKILKYESREVSKPRGKGINL